MGHRKVGLLKKHWLVELPSYTHCHETTNEHVSQKAAAFQDIKCPIYGILDETLRSILLLMGQRTTYKWLYSFKPMHSCLL